MLSPLDDLPVHQAPRPLTQPASTDRNAYGRYWFGALHREGAFQIEAAFGRYPNLRVSDCSLSIAIDGAQHSFHASREAPIDPTDLTIGPFRLEVVEPMRRLRLVVDDNDTGISADLWWTARTGALLEDHTEMQRGPQTIIDMARFIQFGTWSGTMTADGTTVEVTDDAVAGVRDRSWGIRPVGETHPGRPVDHGATCWLWSPVHYDDDCRVAGWFQHAGGEFWRADGHRVPVLDPVPTVIEAEHPEVFRTEPVGQDITFEPGSRRVRRARFELRTRHGIETLELEPIHEFHMRGLGYTNLEWGHGQWKGELTVGAEHWRFDEIDPLDPFHQHVHHLVRARRTDPGGEVAEGVGILEQIIFGAHTQFGFDDFLDGADG